MHGPEELELAVETVDVVGGGEDGFLGGDPGSIVEPRLVDGALGTFGFPESRSIDQFTNARGKKEDED